MEAIVILMGVITLIASAFIYKSKTEKKKKRNRIQNKISETAGQYTLEWTHTDIGDHRGIAWSSASRKLFFIDMAKDKEEFQLIDMNTIHTCNLVESGHSGTVHKTIHTTSVELQLVSKDKGPVITLPFYKEEVDGIYEKMLLTRKAQNWKDLLSK
jgi:hypothetical protein